ncbi:MAG TPA: helix-turn-helix domain-containing protein [Azospirillaceae bacterium]|nr:helix-turn-helix domain-containing protein [Azospirillaceae bacterium]
MSTVRRSLNEIAAGRPRADRAKLAATTEEDVARHAREDGTADGFGDPAPVHRPPLVDVRELRQGLGMTQEGFAAAFGLDVEAVRAWEQGKRRPDRAARVLLAVIAREPDAVRRAVA